MAIRMNQEEREWVAYLQANGTDRSAEEIVRQHRRSHRNTMAKIARRDAHIAKHGHNSASRYYTGI